MLGELGSQAYGALAPQQAAQHPHHAGNGVGHCYGSAASGLRRGLRARVVDGLPFFRNQPGLSVSGAYLAAGRWHQGGKPGPADGQRSGLHPRRSAAAQALVS